MIYQPKLACEGQILCPEHQYQREKGFIRLAPGEIWEPVKKEILYKKLPKTIYKQNFEKLLATCKLQR